MSCSNQHRYSFLKGKKVVKNWSRMFSIPIRQYRLERIPLNSIRNLGSNVSATPLTPFFPGTWVLTICSIRRRNGIIKAFLLFLWNCGSCHLFIIMGDATKLNWKCWFISTDAYNSNFCQQQQKISFFEKYGTLNFIFLDHARFELWLLPTGKNKYPWKNVDVLAQCNNNHLLKKKEKYHKSFLQYSFYFLPQ